MFTSENSNSNTMNISYVLKPRFSLLHIFFALLLAMSCFYYYADQKIEQEKVGARLPPVAITDEEPPVAAYKYRNNYSFTSDWFSSRIPVWREILSPFAGKPDVQYLEVGVFEGRATLWMIENILTDPSSQITAIDLFSGYYDTHHPEFAQRYFSNIALSGASDRTTNITGYSQIELRKLPLNHYDIIYIDGSHKNSDVLEDAILCMRLLKNGGVLIFDDYEKNNVKLGAPKLGIDAFYKFYGENFDVLHNNHQVFLRKKIPSE